MKKAKPKDGRDIYKEENMDIAKLYVLIDTADTLLYEAYSNNNNKEKEEVKKARIDKARSLLWDAEGMLRAEVTVKEENNEPVNPAIV